MKQNIFSKKLLIQWVETAYSESKSSEFNSAERLVGFWYSTSYEVSGDLLVEEEMMKND